MDNCDYIPDANEFLPNGLPAVINGRCTQSIPIAMELKTVHDKVDDLEKSASKVTENFQEFKFECVKTQGNQEKILEGINATLKAEAETKKNQAANQLLLLENLQNIQKDVKSISNNLTSVSTDVVHLKDDSKDQDDRISSLERISYWIYAAIGAIVLLGIIFANWQSIAEFFGKDTCKQQHVEQK